MGLVFNEFLYNRNALINDGSFANQNCGWKDAMKITAGAVFLLTCYLAYAKAACPYVLADNVPCYELESNYCYCVSFIKGTWVEATSRCRSNSALNARLLSIESAAEQAMVTKLIVGTPGLNLLDRFWTSGSDSQSEGNWFWVSTGDFLTYKNWVEGFANNDTEDCMVITKDSGYYWDDAACTTTNYYICEGTPNAVDTTTAQPNTITSTEGTTTSPETTSADYE